MPRYGREDEENGRLAAAQCPRTHGAGGARPSAGAGATAAPMDLRNDPPATAANLLEQRVSDPDVAAAAFDNRPPSAANLSERRVSEQEAPPLVDGIKAMAAPSLLAEDGIKAMAAPSSAASTPSWWRRARCPRSWGLRPTPAPNGSTSVGGM